jgi:energy-coupling factor transporter transmembrane protein EcfT
MQFKHNSLLYFLLAFFYLIPILFSGKADFSLAIAFLALINVLVLTKISLKYLFLFLILLILPLLSVFVTTLLYSKNEPNPEIIHHFGAWEITQTGWQNAIFLASRSFSLSFVSFIFILCIKPTEFVFSLMQNWNLSVVIGYPIMVTFIAFEKLQIEFQRIRLANYMRFHKKIPLISMLIPLLVSASRYAYQTGLSLESRGLHPNKTFIDFYYWHKRDTIVLLINLFQIGFIIAFFY